MGANGSPASLHALILAPRGRDAAIARDLFLRVGVASTHCRTLHELATALGPDVAFVMLTEDAIRDADLRPLVQWIDSQPAWSDLPVILVTNHGGGSEHNPIAGRWLDALGNVSFIERPFHPTTLLSVARAALKGRRRQHETRHLLARLSESEQRLRIALLAGRLRAWELDFNGAGLPDDDEGRLKVLRSALGTVHGDDCRHVLSSLQQSIDGGEDYAVEFRCIDDAGSVRWLDVRARLLRDRSGRILRLVGLTTDITGRKQNDEALRQLNDQLERRVAERTAALQRAHDALIAQIAERERTEEQLRHMQKLESIGQLTGGVAHDFNNLLTAVLGNLELLKKRLPANPDIDRLVDGAVQAAQRGASLTQRLLAFARRQALEPAPVDLADLARGMGELLRRMIGPRIEIRFDLPDGLPAAQADANQVELALLNLALNSRDAMPDGGTLAIALDLVECPAAPDLAAGTYLRLSVVDTGSGMDGETLRRAIEPFFSTKEIGKGTGLGLSMIHGLAVQLGGALRLYSEQGNGTRAELLLPRAAGAAARAAPATPATQPAAEEKVGRATLLYVDDDVLISLSTVALLEDLGHTVIQANSGARALEVLRSDRKIDLLITDYAMPGMTGVQLAEEARRLRPGLPILLATGYADLPAPTEPDLPRLGKPFVQSQLAERIAALIE